MVKIINVEYLRNLIKKCGYNYTDFSKKIGISRSELYKIFSIEGASPKVSKKIMNVLKGNCAGIQVKYADIFNWL